MAPRIDQTSTGSTCYEEEEEEEDGKDKKARRKRSGPHGEQRTSRHAPKW